jgi:uncharacterized membrane protein
MSTVSLPKQRVASIDFLRGAIMIIMALDHVRDYFHWASFQYNPLDLDKTSAPIFFTRWITHYCAPIFMMLSGISAFLNGRKKTKKELSFFLFSRGLWLVLLELTVVNFGWNFDIEFHSILFITIWALGICMIALSLLVFLPLKFVLAISIIMIAGHNLMDSIQMNGNNLQSFGWAMLHQQNGFNWQGRMVLVGYPIIPWVGVMALGYCMGYLYVHYDAVKRKRLLLLYGVSAITLFFIIRFVNIYGDPFHWEKQEGFLFTLLSFLNTNKYPPSLLFILMTLGPGCIFVALTENITNGFSKFVSVYGRVPMFYYILHIYLIHLLAMITSELFTTHDWSKWIFHEPLWFIQSFRGYGFPLVIVYLVWIIVVIALYPLCKWYDAYKQAHKEKWWLSYV